MSYWLPQITEPVLEGAALMRGSPPPHWAEPYIDLGAQKMEQLLRAGGPGEDQREDS